MTVMVLMMMMMMMMHFNIRGGGRLDGRRVSSLGDEMYYTIEPEKVMMMKLSMLVMLMMVAPQRTQKL